jgi:hypothetical protein
MKFRLKSLNQIYSSMARTSQYLLYIPIIFQNKTYCRFYEQGNILEIYLKKLAIAMTSKILHIPFTKAA